MPDKTFTVGAKIVLICAVAIVALATITAISFVTVTNMKSSFQEMATKQIASKVAALSITRDVNYISRLTRNIMLGSNYEKDMKKLGDRIKSIRANFEILQTATVGFDSEPHVAKAKKATISFVEDGRQFVTRLGDTPVGERYKSYPAYGKSATPYAVESRKDFGNLIKQIDHNFRTSIADFQATISRAQIILTVSFVLIILALCTTGFIIKRSITKPINRIIGNLTDGSGRVYTTSGQISSASQILSDGSSQQAAAIEETSSSMEEMSSMTKQNAANASEADSLMKQALGVIQTAGDSMGEMGDSMEEISAASNETSKIVKTIDEIAFQTNLLALNAAVEAARAGEAGAGFAVVADEVRNLAMRAADAAKITNQLIEGTVEKVEKGKKVVNKTNDSFHEVAAITSKIGALVGEIATASQDQTQGFSQINQAIIQMESVTQQNSASAEESASAAEELNSQAENMTDMVMNLKVLVGGDQEETMTAGQNRWSATDGHIPTLPQ